MPSFGLSFHSLLLCLSFAEEMSKLCRDLASTELSLIRLNAVRGKSERVAKVYCSKRYKGAFKVAMMARSLC